MSTTTVEREAPATPAPNPEAPRPAPRPPVAEFSVKPRGRWMVRLIPLVVLVVIAGIGGSIGISAYRDNQAYVSTENAQLTGQLIQVGGMNAGRIETINVTLSQPVRQGDVIATIVLPSQIGMTQNGTPRMDFLGASDTRIDVRSPIDGVVVAIPGAVGGSVAAGQTVVTLVDPAHLWVNANIEETKIERLRIGQPVDVHIDALGVTVPGTVDAITPATSAVFSLLPASNASGNFTKVTQLVPVRVAVDLSQQSLLLGSSVSVRIHVNGN